MEIKRSARKTGRELARRKPKSRAGAVAGARTKAAEAIDYGPLDAWVGFNLRMAQEASFQAFSRRSKDIGAQPRPVRHAHADRREPGHQPDRAQPRQRPRQVDPHAAARRSCAPRPDPADAHARRTAAAIGSRSPPPAAACCGSSPSSPARTSATSTASSARASARSFCACCGGSRRRSSEAGRYSRANRAITSGGTGVDLILAASFGSCTTHTRVSEHSTATLPSLMQPMAHVEARAAEVRHGGLDDHVVAEAGGKQKTRADVDQRKARERIGLQDLALVHAERGARTRRSCSGRKSRNSAGNR